MHAHTHSYLLQTVLTNYSYTICCDIFFSFFLTKLRTLFDLLIYPRIHGYLALKSVKILINLSFEKIFEIENLQVRFQLGQGLVLQEQETENIYVDFEVRKRFKQK